MPQVAAVPTAPAMPTPQSVAPQPHYVAPPASERPRDSLGPRIADVDMGAAAPTVSRAVALSPLAVLSQNPLHKRRFGATALRCHHVESCSRKFSTLSPAGPLAMRVVTPTAPVVSRRPPADPAHSAHTAEPTEKGVVHHRAAASPQSICP